LCNFRCKDAGVVSCKESGGIGVDSDASHVRLVMGAEHSVKVADAKVWLLCSVYQHPVYGVSSWKELTLGNGPLSSKLIHYCAATSMQSDVVTTRLECISAVRKRSLVVRQVSSPLCSILRMLCSTLAWVSERDLSKEGDGTEKDRKFHDRQVLAGLRYRRKAMVIGIQTTAGQRFYICRFPVYTSFLGRKVYRGNETMAWCSSCYPCPCPCPMFCMHVSL
jgi:hypothetical protein